MFNFGYQFSYDILLNTNSMYQLTTDDKFRILSKMYFGISDSQNHDVNPFEDLSSFLKSKVKSMHWGKQKKASKERFCKKFIQVLELYNIFLEEDFILKSLEKEETSNRDMVKIWAASAIFDHYLTLRKSA